MQKSRNESDHLSHVTGLRNERISLVSGWRDARGQDGRQIRRFSAETLYETDAIHRAGHLDVRKHEIDLSSRLKKGQGLICGRSLEDQKTLSSQFVRDHHADQNLVFNDQNACQPFLQFRRRRQGLLSWNLIEL
jgi:hypothetical protein